MPYVGFFHRCCNFGTECDCNIIHQLRACVATERAIIIKSLKKKYQCPLESATANHGLFESTLVTVSSSAPWYLRCSPDFTELFLDWCVVSWFRVSDSESAGLTSAPFTGISANCDDARCPHDTVEVTRGVAGICPSIGDISVSTVLVLKPSPDPSRTQVCSKGKKKLCCPRDIQVQKCEFTFDSSDPVSHHCPQLAGEWSGSGKLLLDNISFLH